MLYHRVLFMMMLGVDSSNRVPLVRVPLRGSITGEGGGTVIEMIDLSRHVKLSGNLTTGNRETTGSFDSSSSSSSFSSGARELGEVGLTMTIANLKASLASMAALLQNTVTDISEKQIVKYSLWTLILFLFCFFPRVSSCD